MVVHTKVEIDSDHSRNKTTFDQLFAAGKWPLVTFTSKLPIGKGMVLPEEGQLVRYWSFGCVTKLQEVQALPYAIIDFAAHVPMLNTMSLQKIGMFGSHALSKDAVLFIPHGADLPQLPHGRIERYGKEAKLSEVVSRYIKSNFSKIKPGNAVYTVDVSAVSLKPTAAATSIAVGSSNLMGNYFIDAFVDNKNMKPKPYYQLARGLETLFNTLLPVSHSITRAWLDEALENINSFKIKNEQILANAPNVMQSCLNEWAVYVLGVKTNMNKEHAIKSEVFSTGLKQLLDAKFGVPEGMVMKETMGVVLKNVMTQTLPLSEQEQPRDIEEAVAELKSDAIIEARGRDEKIDDEVDRQIACGAGTITFYGTINTTEVDTSTCQNPALSSQTAITDRKNSKETDDPLAASWAQLPLPSRVPLPMNDDEDTEMVHVLPANKVREIEEQEARHYSLPSSTPTGTATLAAQVPSAAPQAGGWSTPVSYMAGWLWGGGK